MTIMTSTGLRYGMVALGSLKSLLDGGFIKVYSGSVPASADAAVTGTLLWTVKLNDTATGLTLESTIGSGSLTKPASDIWSGTVLASGLATYYRHVSASDTGASSTSEPRIQGTVGTVGTDLLIGDANLVVTAVQAVDYYTITLPT